MNPEHQEKLKLMVVDDESDNLELLYRTFWRDFQVFRADGADQALEILAQEGEMAIIISDQRMPMMNGTEFLGKIVDLFPDTIRILLTGYTDVEDLVEAINSGKVYRYITKPWNPGKLKEIVKEAVNTYRAVKRRTNELTRALRREELFNIITSAIRESLDYESMLQTIVQTIGANFGAHLGSLYPVAQEHLTSPSFHYQAPQQAAQQEPNLAQSLCSKVLSSRQTQQLEDSGESATISVHLAIPLTFSQELLAVLYLYLDSITKSDLELLEDVVEQAAIAISQAKLYQRIQQQAQQMRSELQVARQIQHNLLRQTLPEVDQVKVQASCYPAREVGGDFFEVYHHPQGDLWLAVGDVSGKGVPAALFMASAISILRRELAQETSPAPNVVMQNINRTMSEDLISANCFITMALARYTVTTKELVYASAGHIYPLVWSHKSLMEQRTDAQPNYLKVRGVPLGILPLWQAQAGSLVLNQGDILLLTSDGITEATITKEMTQVSRASNNRQLDVGSMLNQEGLWQLIMDESEHNFDLNRLLSRLREYTNTIQEDDQTILSLEVL